MTAPSLNAPTSRITLQRRHLALVGIILNSSKTPEEHQQAHREAQHISANLAKRLKPPRQSR